MKPLRILLSHSTCPAQFRRLAPALVEAGHEVVFLHRHREWHAPDPQGYRCIPYSVSRTTEEPALHPYLRRFDAAVLEGQGAFRAARQLADEGFQPDLVISHAGFGSGLYLADAFPKAKRIGLFEWYYNAFGSDVDFLNEGSVEVDRQLRVRTWNAHLLLELASCHAAVVPTRWQQQQFPEPWRSKLHRIHEGIDVPTLQKLRKPPPPRPSCLPQQEGIEVVTYVSRGFEPYRGFPQAAAALASLQRRRPDVHVLMVGSDEVCYGAARSDGRSWKQWAQEEAGLNPARTHWLGALQTDDYHAVLAHSQAHLYLTVPFVLSWSLLEAMAAGCPIVASGTPPVAEAIRHGKEGVLVPFSDPGAIADGLELLLKDAVLAEKLRIQAQERATRYSAEKGIQRWLDTIRTVVR